MPWTDNEKLVDDQGQRPKKSKAAPVLDGMVSGGFLLMVHLGDSSDGIWYSTLERGESRWGPDRRAGALRSRIAPAMAAGRMFYSDSGTGALSWDAFSAGWVFPEDPVLRNAQGGTAGNNVHPAAVAAGDLIHLIVWNHSGPRIAHLLVRNRNLLDFSDTIGNQSQGTFRTKARPAVALMGNTLHVVHLGEESNQLWHARGRLSFDDSGELSVVWRERQIGGQKSRMSPALAVYNGRLHMVHLGDTSTTLWHAIYIDEFGSWTQTAIPRQASKMTPGLAAFDGALHLVHLGEESNQIWWSTWTDSA